MFYISPKCLNLCTSGWQRESFQPEDNICNRASCKFMKRRPTTATFKMDEQCFKLGAFCPTVYTALSVGP
jgi:hypothetical protein